MKNIKPTYLVIAGLLLYILFLQECSGHRNQIDGGETIIDTLKHTTDTIRISHTDTITLPAETHYVTTHINTPTILRDTVYILGERVIDSTHLYTNAYEDSLLSGTISTEVDGTLVAVGFTYIPKFPKYIIKIDTITINNTTVIEKKRTKFYIGMELGGNNNTFNISPVVDIQTKKGYMYGYRYGLVDKTHNIRFSKTLSFKRKI